MSDVTRSSIYILILFLLTPAAPRAVGARSVKRVQSTEKPKPNAAALASQEAFFDAVGEGKLDIVRRLLQENPVLLSAREGGSSPLHVAVINKQEEVIKLLLEKKADPNAKDDREWTPLHWAVWYGSSTLTLTELMLAGKADPNLANASGETPLHLAESEGAVELLVSKGADVGARNEDGSTPLHSAASWGREDVVVALLRKKADINAQDKKGNTPLHVVVDSAGEDRKWIREIAEILVANKADVNSRNNEGLTPLKSAEGHKDKEVVELLIKNGAKQ